jgi:hypothetical protein
MHIALHIYIPVISMINPVFLTNSHGDLINKIADLNLSNLWKKECLLHGTLTEARFSA